MLQAPGPDMALKIDVVEAEFGGGVANRLENRLRKALPFDNRLRFVQ
jgi:hypothetical protein